MCQSSPVNSHALLYRTKTHSRKLRQQYFVKSCTHDTAGVLALRFTLQLLEEVTAENFGDKINREPLHQDAGMEQVEQRSRLEV